MQTLYYVSQNHLLEDPGSVGPAGAPLLAALLKSPVTHCSRCTGYRPILDAFRVFAEVPPGAYTEEAIAAHSQGRTDDEGPVDRTQPTGYPANGTIRMDRSKAVSHAFTMCI